MNGMEYVFGCEGFEPGHSRLRELTLCSLSSAISICKGSAPRAMFQTLKSLFINKCNFRGSLFTVDVAHCLYQLESLIVVSRDFLERVIEEREETVNKKMTFWLKLNKKTIVLPKLKSLVLKKLPMLYMSGSCTIDIECPSLEYLYVKECPQFSASATDFKSKNQIQPLDRIPYIDQLFKRFIDYDPWGYQNPLCNLVGLNINKFSEKVMHGMIEKWPDFMDSLLGSTEGMREFKDDLHILMETVPQIKDIY